MVSGLWAPNPVLRATHGTCPDIGPARIFAANETPAGLNRRGVHLSKWLGEFLGATENWAGCCEGRNIPPGTMPSALLQVLLTQVPSRLPLLQPEAVSSATSEPMLHSASFLLLLSFSDKSLCGGPIG